MTQDQLYVISIGLLITIFADYWRNRKSNVDRKPVVKTYSCHHQEEVEFSGAYRDAARQTKKCGYKLTCSIKTTGKAKVDLYCPTHDVKLKS